MSIPFRLKQMISRTDKVLWAAFLISFSLSLQGITVKYNNPDQMAFLPLFHEGKLPFNPGWFDKPPFHTYFNYFLSILPASLLSKGFAISAPALEIMKTVWSRLLTKLMLLIVIGLLYRISRKSFSLLSSRTLALIAATTAGYIAYSHFLTVDLPVMFWMFVAFSFSHNILFNQKTSNYVFAGFFTGIAAATKYNGIVIGITIVVAHILSHHLVSWKNIPWRGLLFDKRLLAGLAMVGVGFIAGNPFAILDYRSFYYGFIYNYMVTPVYEGQTGLSFIRFFGKIIEIIGLPFFIVSIAAFFTGLYAVIQKSGEWRSRATFLLCLAVFIPYYLQFGMFPRLETRFVLPIMPLWLLLTGAFWEKIQAYKVIPGVILLSLLGYNLVCSAYVGKRILDDPRILSESWIQQNMPSGSTVEKDIYSPSWLYMPEVEAQVNVMPFVTGRERLFEVLFPGNTFINGSGEDWQRTEEMIAWYSEESLMSRNPDYLVIDSLYYQRFLQPGIRRDLYPSMYQYFDSLLSDRTPYQIVFDRESKQVPSWVYPQEMDFIHNRLTILARSENHSPRTEESNP